MNRLSVREALGGAPVPPYLRGAVENALSFPWCWPSDLTLQATARSYAAQPPAPPKRGEVLLVSVAEGTAREGLWALRWKHPLHQPGVPFGTTMGVSLERAARCASGAVPHLHTIAPAMPSQWPRSALRICKRGDDLDRVLDDRSYGLSLALAAASELMGRPVSERLAASAIVDADGSLRRVDGLERKLSMIVENALAVDTVLVAQEQAAEAESLLAGQPRRVRVIGLASVSQAVGRVFPEAREAPPAAWEGGGARAVINDLIELCRKGAPLPLWGAVVRSAEWLAARSDLGSPMTSRLRVAAQIARRHAQGESIAIDWDEAVVPAYDCEMAAHVVQAAADAGVAAIDDCLRRAESLLGHGHDGPAERKLAGAVGRALSAQRRYAKAARHLAPATQSWLDDGGVAEASYPLSEWLRVAAITDDESRWSEAVGCSAPYLAADDPADLGPAFVRFALGRGLVTRGDFAAGLHHLASIDRRHVPPFLWRSARRWDAIARVASGQATRAKELRAALHAELDDGGGPTIESIFARLDEALEQGADPTPAIAAIRDANPQGVRWLFAPDITPVEQGRRLAREYPY